jgi:hypothetical protein
VAAAIEAGVAIGLQGETSGSTNLRRLGPEDGFNPMPISTLVMARRAEAEDGSIVAMERAIRDAFATTAGQA